MNVIGRLTPSLESQVNLKKFRGISTSDALQRMSGVRITGLLGSMTAIYGFSIDIFEDIQKEINIINDKLDTIRDKAKILKEIQLEYERDIEEKRQLEKQKKKEREKKEKKEKEKKGKEDKSKALAKNQMKSNQFDLYRIPENEATLEDDDIVIKQIDEFDTNYRSDKSFINQYEQYFNEYQMYEKIRKKKEKIERKKKEEENEKIFKIYINKEKEEDNEIDKKGKLIEKNILASKEKQMKKETEKQIKEKKEKEKLKETEKQKRENEEEIHKEYAYEFAYEYQYSSFEDECLKTALKQREEKFNFSAENKEKKNQILEISNSLPQKLKINQPEDQENLLEFVSMPVSDNEC